MRFLSLVLLFAVAASQHIAHDMSIPEPMINEPDPYLEFVEEKPPQEPQVYLPEPAPAPAPAPEQKHYEEAPKHYEPEPETHEEEPSTQQPILEVVKELFLPSLHPLHQSTAILTGGKKLAAGLTAKIVAPIIIFNSKVSKVAGALPPLLAAKGAVIGSAVATPIQIGAFASSALATKLTGKLVAVPITLAAATASKFVDAVERGEEVVRFNIEHGGEILKDGLIRVGQLILKPIAIVVGAQTAIIGTAVGIAGTGVKGVGLGIKAVGAKMTAAGLGAKFLGGRLIQAQFPPYL